MEKNLKKNGYMYMYNWITLLYAAAAAKSLQSCPTLCDPTDGGPPGSPVPGILQARTLEWLAISFSSAWKWKLKVKSLSHVWPSVTPWTAAHQAPPSMGFSRQEYWSGVPLAIYLKRKQHCKSTILQYKIKFFQKLHAEIRFLFLIPLCQFVCPYGIWGLNIVSVCLS